MTLQVFPPNFQVGKKVCVSTSKKFLIEFKDKTGTIIRFSEERKFVQVSFDDGLFQDERMWFIFGEIELLEEQ